MASAGRLWRKVLQGEQGAVLVDAAGHGEVPAGAIPLDGEPVECAFRTGAGCGGSENVESVARGRDLDVVVGVAGQEGSSCVGGLPIDEAVVEVDAGVSVAEDEADSVSLFGCSYGGEGCPCRWVGA